MKIITDENDSFTGFKFIKPFDAHVHFREDNMMKTVVPYSAREYRDFIVMPNLKLPIINVKMAIKYQEELKMLYKSPNHYMTLYLREKTSIQDVKDVSENENVIGFKLYPLDATTGSQDGISDVKNVYHLFEKMERLNVPLLIHGEVTREEIDIFDREKIFIEETLTDIVEKFPKLKITLEHITTKEAVEFVKANKNVWASITAHHLLINRNAIFRVGKNTNLNPHNFCMPVAKREKHRKALLEAAFSGNDKFFAGTDSAPHLVSDKESGCGCAGCFTGLHSVELYFTAFMQYYGFIDSQNGEIFEFFMSVNGRKRYGIEMPKSDDVIFIKKEKWTIPLSIKQIVGPDIIPFMYGEELEYKRKSFTAGEF